MEKQELIDFLHKQEEVIYNNGKNSDIFHLGQILSIFIENNEGTKSYQTFNNILNEVLTQTGSQELLTLNDAGIFDNYKILIRAEIDKEYSELKIIYEFKLLLELINNQLKEIIIQKQEIIKKYIKNHIHSLIGDVIDEDLENIQSFVEKLIFEEYHLENLNSNELNLIQSNSIKTNLDPIIEKSLIFYIESKNI